MTIRIPLGVRQHSACEIYVCDVAHECTACELDGATLVVHDLWAAMNAVVDGANSADCDKGSEGLRDSLSALGVKLSRMYESKERKP